MIPQHLVHEMLEIELRTRRRVRNSRAGTFVSTSRGDGFDFEQHRPYRAGDDVRRIDWNATARAGMPFVRQMRAERDLQVTIAIDLSRSMELPGFGRSKHDALVLVSAALLFSALEARLGVNLLGFSGDVMQSYGPLSRGEAAWSALTVLWGRRPPKGTTRLGPAVQHLLRTLRQTTLVIVVSDFQIEEDPASLGELSILGARHDVVGVVIEGRTEAHLPAGSGFVRVRDVESDATSSVALTSRNRALFEEAVQRRRRSLRDAFYRAGISQVPIDPDDDVLEPILKLFEGR